MADEQQKTNTNGRPILVLKKEYLESVANNSSTASDLLGYVKDAGDVVKAEDFNFRWGLVHHKGAPIFSKERWGKVTNFKMYTRNSETGRIFTGNQHTKVVNTKKVLNNLDKIGSGLGNLGDGTELLIAVAEKDSKALASKTSTLVLSKVGEAAGERVGVAVAGKCVNFAATKIDPRKIAIAGGICATATIALKHSGDFLGNKVGEQVGGSDIAIKTAQSALAVLDAIDITDKMDKQAEEKRRQREKAKDPMVEFQINSSD